MSKKTILVADDDVGILEALDMIFSDAGYAVKVAPNGQVALDLVHQSLPDLILLDLMMPIATGWDVMREVRADPRSKDVPVIILSADHNVAKKAAALQADDYCAKPFDVDEVVTKVEQLLGE
jgi:DNA-binding response OmpR family regulator